MTRAQLRLLTGCRQTTVRQMVFTTLLMVASPWAAGNPKQGTTEEIALLSPFCPYTMSYGRYETTEAKSWKARLGERSFSSLHHYCWAQVSWQRAFRSGTPARERRHLLETARADNLYVVDFVSKDFVLLPEILSRTGEIELHLGRYPEANKYFAQARSLRPDYWPAYSHWASFLIGAGRTAEAKQLVKTGLEYSPTSRILKDLYRSVGGNPAEVVAKSAKAEKEVAAAAEELPEGEGIDALLAETEAAVSGVRAR